MSYMNFCLMKNILWAAREQCVFPNTYIKFTVHRPSCYEKKRVDTGIGGRNGASRVRSREFMATGLRDRRRNVGCRLRLSTRARERDASLSLLRSPSRLPVNPRHFSKRPEREVKVKVSEKPRIMIDILSNAGGKIRYLWVSMNQPCLFSRTI